MNLLCAVGRHRWVGRQGRGERGEDVSYQQCERCGHYPKTSHWSQGDVFKDHPMDTQGGGGGVAG